MDNLYLLELINEAKSRGGGLLLNFEDKPSVVVLTVERYNQIMNTRSSTQVLEPTTQTQMQKQTNIPKKVLVTGGAGYIGGHLVRQLTKSGYEVTVLDNLSTGKKSNLDPKATFIEGSLADVSLLKDVFAANKFDGVFHMAASLEVEESVREPEKYFENNVVNLTHLLRAMHEAGVNKIIFSSSAAVYGQPDHTPITETASLRPANPYGYTKLLGERLIKYYCEYLGFQAVAFRYFNACGFDVDAHIVPTHQSHLIYNVMLVAKGERPALQVFGNDYETADGTCIRDYVHVLDIVSPHILALEKMANGAKFEVYNIGTGNGVSVAQVANATSEILNKIIPMDMAPRRAGDPASLTADNNKLVNNLGYHLQYSSLENIIKTSWEVQSKM
ncbi:MAG TPA: UDP-glucose 4-epimerase GalE [Candidatus Limnocylindria bacterium]|nr:UDP-glucose 4-epimerase GalE [Candidatus Limnocylindria bacterium]